MIPNLTVPTYWTVVLVCAPMLIAGCGGATNGPTPPTDDDTAPAEDEIEVTGTLTDEGVECPAVRGDDGQLYTLAGGDLEGFSTGDRLRIRGTVAQMSFCMQGTTIAVESVESLDSED